MFARVTKNYILPNCQTSKRPSPIPKRTSSPEFNVHSKRESDESHSLGSLTPFTLPSFFTSSNFFATAISCSAEGELNSGDGRGEVSGRSRGSRHRRCPFRLVDAHLGEGIALGSPGVVTRWPPVVWTWGERLSRSSGHVAERHARSHGGVTKRCAEPVRGQCRSVCGERWC